MTPASISFPKTTGFDPLIKHLKAQRFSCQRSAAVTDIPTIKIVNAESVTESRCFAGHSDQVRKPRTVKTRGWRQRGQDIAVATAGAAEGRALNRARVTRGVRCLLEYGILDHGLLRLRCADSAHEKFVALSQSDTVSYCVSAV